MDVGYDGAIMDFERVLRVVLEAFEHDRVRYGVLGGFALAALGVPRTTMDIDFLIHRDDLPAVDRLLTGFGYVQRVRTENASHYRHPDAGWGSIDLLHAFRHYSLDALDRTSTHAVFGGTLQIKVLRPEDVIGFKVQAIANNPLRVAKDALDIETLMDFFRSRLDWNRVQEYYELFERGKEGRRLRERYAHVE